MIPCSYCNADMPDGATYCNRCGRSLAPRFPGRSVGDTPTGGLKAGIPDLKETARPPEQERLEELEQQLRRLEKERAAVAYDQERLQKEAEDQRQTAAETEKEAAEAKQVQKDIEKELAAARDLLAEKKQALARIAEEEGRRREKSPPPPKLITSTSEPRSGRPVAAYCIGALVCAALAVSILDAEAVLRSGAITSALIRAFTRRLLFIAFFGTVGLLLGARLSAIFMRDRRTVSHTFQAHCAVLAVVVAFGLLEWGRNTPEVPSRQYAENVRWHEEQARKQREVDTAIRVIIDSAEAARRQMRFPRNDSTLDDSRVYRDGNRNGVVFEFVYSAKAGMLRGSINAEKMKRNLIQQAYGSDPRVRAESQKCDEMGIYFTQLDWLS